MFTGKHQCEILKNTYVEEDLCMADSQLTLWSDCEEFFSGSHLKPSWLSNITKYQSLSNQSFKQNLVHIPSIYLTMVSLIQPLHFLVNLGFKCSSLTVTLLLVKRCNNVLCVLWRDRKYCRWNCNGNTWTNTSQKQPPEVFYRKRYS